MPENICQRVTGFTYNPTIIGSDHIFFTLPTLRHHLWGPLVHITRAPQNAPLPPAHLHRPRGRGGHAGHHSRRRRRQALAGHRGADAQVATAQAGPRPARAEAGSADARRRDSRAPLRRGRRRVQRHAPAPAGRQHAGRAHHRGRVHPVHDQRRRLRGEAEGRHHARRPRRKRGPEILTLSSTGTLSLFQSWGADSTGYATWSGTGWQIYNKVFAPGDVTGDGRPDLLARTYGGDLYLYQGTGSVDSPFRGRVKVGAAGRCSTSWWAWAT